MELQLNGELRLVEKNLSISALTKSLGLEQQRYAVEVNRCVVPKSLHASHRPEAGYHGELIQAMGGG